jgi:hypothetical protein
MRLAPGADELKVGQYRCDFIGRIPGMDRSSAAFMSYARFDDEHNGGQLTKFRKLLSGEVRALLGRQFDIFQDTSDIAFGQEWQGRIRAGIDECALFMPIITPSFFNSAACRYELERFAANEAALGRNDLILPVYYITCPILDDGPASSGDPLVRLIAERNYFDLRALRGRPPGIRLFQTRLTELAMRVIALERTRPRRRRLASVIAGARTSAAAPAKANPAASDDAGPGADDQPASDLTDWWNRMRRYLVVAECAHKEE